MKQYLRGKEMDKMSEKKKEQKRNKIKIIKCIKKGESNSVEHDEMSVFLSLCFTKA